MTFNPTGFMRRLRGKHESTSSRQTGCSQRSQSVASQWLRHFSNNPNWLQPKNESVANVASFWDSKNQSSECDINATKRDNDTFFLGDKTEPPKLATLATPAENADFLNNANILSVASDWLRLATPGYAHDDGIEVSLARLDMECPLYVDAERWRQAVADAKEFMDQWGERAAALGWTGADLVGLHEPPADPHPSYNRMSRVDCMGLVWMLNGDPVVEVAADNALIRRRTGSINVFRRHK
jgi:hypothetical protein